MKRIVIATAFISVSLLVGCAPRYQSQEEAAMTRAAMVGAAEGQALRNAQALYPVQQAQSAKERHANQVSQKHANYKQLTNEAEAVINGTIGDGAEFLLSCGWKANNGEWHKQGYTLKLVVEDGIVVNSQLTK
ncbi:UNVERIFIED_CONTAM: hypothetical protein RF648_19895 [Kocuria sp. CPCC 205274]